MLKSKAALALSEGLFVSLLAICAPAARAQHELSEGVRAPRIAPASDEGELAIKKFQVPPGLKVDLWAAEPMFANPVAFNFDEKGRAYVCETFRLNAGVDDIRGIMDWLDEELASRTVDDRLAEMKRHLGERFARYSEHSERISRIEDRDGDGKVYFSIGDRGSNVKLADGRRVGDPDTGCVFRCNPDGSELEVFAFGLRNPQDLVFDQYGNLFTGDNNSDSGDQARWVYVVEGGDSGWRVGYQFMERPYSRGPFNAEKLWYPHFDGQAAYIVPPITNIAAGPSGVAYFPGTGLPDQFQDHFFLVDFRGGGANSGVHTFTLKPKGAYFELAQPQHFIWGVLATDVKFGVEGGAYVSDWVQGWDLTGKGRIYRVHDPAIDKDPIVLETKKLLAQGMEKRSLKELARLLAHRDIRVRQEAQFALADRGPQAIKTLASVARNDSSQLARLHAIWGLGQMAECRNPNAECKPAAALEPLLPLLEESDDEVRAQAAKVLGERRCLKAYNGLIKLSGDASSRVRYFAIMGLGKLGSREALPAIFAMLRDNADKDPYLRHAGVMALNWIGDIDALLAAAKDRSSAIRL